jgi:hypothetical protein
MPWSWHEEQMANMIKTGKFQTPEEAGFRVYRASGECLCPVCHREYRTHPVNVPYWDLHILCNGDHVHL